MSIDFVVKHIPRMRVAQIRYSGDEGLDFYTLAEFAMTAGLALHEAMQSASIEPAGPTFLHYEERPDATLTPIVAMPIGDEPFTEAPGITVDDLPPIDAVTVYRGPGGHHLIGPIYGQMARYADDHGYTIQGPGRDHVVNRDDSTDIVFELQLPVTRDASA